MRGALDFERLHPDRVIATAPELLAEVRPGEHAPADRPYVLLNMVATVDGRAAIAGRSGAIGSPADTRMLAELRAITDAVMVGSGTLRAERYGRLVRDAGRRARRAAAGLAEDPVAVILSRSLELPWDAELFAEPAQRVIVACPTGADREPPATAAPVELLRLADPRPGGVLRELRVRHGIRSVLCEGGPTLNGQLLADGVLDELFLTVGPLLSGDEDEPTILGGPVMAERATLVLRWVLRHDSELFLRYAVAAGG